MASAAGDGAGEDARPAGELRRARRIAAVGVAIIRALAATWRIRVVDREAVDALRAERRPIVFAFWHGDMLPLVWQHRNEGAAILISSHRDGEIIARITESFGFNTVRGSTSRGAGRALLGLVRTLQEGRDVAVTPDGPRGPARRFAPGALVAAQRGAAPIVAVAVHAGPAWRLRSWDRFLIPKPFARVTVAYGPPTRVAATTSREAVGEAGRFERLLAETAAVAGAAHGRG